MIYTENAIPKMTSYTSPSGIVTSNGESSDSRKAWMAMDGLETTYWLASTKGSGWLAYEFSEVKRIEKYSICHPTGGNTALERMPTTWFFQGWDGLTWQPLDSQTDIVWSNAGDTKEFSFLNRYFYKKYRINIIESGNLDLQPVIAEFKMFEAIYKNKLLFRTNDSIASITDKKLVFIQPLLTNQSEFSFEKYGVDLNMNSLSRVLTQNQRISNQSESYGIGKTYEHKIDLNKNNIINGINLFVE